MPKKLPKGLHQIYQMWCDHHLTYASGAQDSQAGPESYERTDLSLDPEQVCQHENGIHIDRTGRLFGIRVLQSDSRDIDENLSLEEELVQQAERGVLCLLFWRNEDCVVIGRHQDPEAECRLEAAEKLGIRIARRRTGGGAVFQDMGNLNVSFIAHADSLDEEICENILLKALVKSGVDARKTGRNDLVLNDTGLMNPVNLVNPVNSMNPVNLVNPVNSMNPVNLKNPVNLMNSGMETTESVEKNVAAGAGQEAGEGGKFSGSASRETPEGIFLFHATLMFDVDLDRMTAVLNASPGKLARHRIASVRSRVTNLREHYPDLKMETVMQAIISESTAIIPDAK